MHTWLSQALLILVMVVTMVGTAHAWVPHALQLQAALSAYQGDNHAIGD